MQHLVVDDVLDDVARHAPVVKHPADDDGIVRGIVMPKAIAGMFAAPGKLRTSHQSVEKSPVEIVENFLQMIMMAARRVNMFSPSQLTHEPRLRGQFMAADITPIARALCAVNRLAIEFGQQDMGNRMQHRFGRAFEQIRESNVKFGVAQANRVVDRDKRIKADVHRRGGRAGSQVGISFVEDFGKSWGHDEVKISTRADCGQPASARTLKVL